MPSRTPRRQSDWVAKARSTIDRPGRAQLRRRRGRRPPCRRNARRRPAARLRLARRCPRRSGPHNRSGRRDSRPRRGSRSRWLCTTRLRETPLCLPRASPRRLRRKSSACVHRKRARRSSADEPRSQCVAVDGPGQQSHHRSWRRVVRGGPTDHVRDQLPQLLQPAAAHMCIEHTVEAADDPSQHRVGNGSRPCAAVRACRAAGLRIRSSAARDARFQPVLRRRPRRAPAHVAGISIARSNSFAIASCAPSAGSAAAS